MVPLITSRCEHWGPKWCIKEKDLDHTFRTNSTQVRDLHEDLGEHVRLAGPSFPHVELEGLKEWLLQPVHLAWIFQFWAVCKCSTA